jgi:hypothetical protein
MLKRKAAELYLYRIQCLERGQPERLAFSFAPDAPFLATYIPFLPRPAEPTYNHPRRGPSARAAPHQRQSPSPSSQPGIPIPPTQACL